MNVLITCKYEEEPIKNEGVRVFTTFPHYNPIGTVCSHGNRSSYPTWSKTLCNQAHIPMMLKIKFGYDWPTGCGDIRV